MIKAHQVLFFVLLLVLCRGEEIIINETTYAVDHCEVFALSVSNNFWRGGDILVCNNASHYFMNVSLNDSTDFTGSESVKFSVATDKTFIVDAGRPVAGQLLVHSGALTGKTWADSMDFADVLSGGAAVSCESLIYAAVHVDVASASSTNTAFGGNVDQCVTAQDSVAGGWYCWIVYQAGCPPPPPSLPPPEQTCDENPDQDKCWTWDCQTSYAYGTHALNTLNSRLGSNRWGWAALVTASSTPTYKMYAGAGGNDFINKGYQSGEVTYYYQGQIAYVKLTLASNCVSPDYQIYIGDPLPADLAANGKFPFKGSSLPQGSTNIIPREGVSVQDFVLPAGIWFISHVNTCCRVRAVV